MRLHGFLKAEDAAGLDFGMFQAGLLAAQAALPTARLCRRDTAASGRAEALFGLLGQLVAEPGRECWLRGSFAEAHQPESFMTAPFTLRFQSSLKRQP